MTTKPTYELYLDSLKTVQDKRSAEDLAGIPRWRAGGSGYLVPGRELYVGHCMRKSILRYHNIEVETHEPKRTLMFEHGFSNEDSWIATLKNSGIPADRIKCEEEIPQTWTTSTGVTVTGRPDMVTLAEDGSVEKLYELKAVCSLWTAKSVLLESKPKDNHLAQAAHYFWQTGALQAELLYTSRVDWAIGKTYHGMFQKNIDKLGVSDYFEYGDEGFLKKLSPFFVSYKLDWHTDGHLLYQQILMDGSEGPMVKTEITTEGIRKYYETLSSSLSLNKLPSRPSQRTATGSRASYRDCQYCPLSPVCDKAESKGLTEWMDEVVAWHKQAPKVAQLEALHSLSKKK